MKNINGWKSASQIEHNISSTWSVRVGKNTSEYNDVRAVAHALKSWHPVQRTMVARPFDSTYRPAIFIPELAIQLRKGYRRQSIIGISLTLAFAVLMFLLTYSKPNQVSYGAITVFTLIGIARWFDAFVSLRTIEGLEERALFFIWLKNSQVIKQGFVFCAVFLIFIGISQLILQSASGGLESLVGTYGIDYAKVRDGEVWRLLLGPFFHSSKIHYLNNFLFLLFVGPITWAIAGRWSLLVFFLGNIFGSVFQMYFGSKNFDSYLGISPGVFALFGLLVCAGLSQPTLLPKGVANLFLWIFLISTIGSELVVKQSATISHISGFIVGAIASTIMIRCRAKSDLLQ